MKKQLFFSGLCLSALSLLMWTACEDYIPFNEEEIKATMDARAYEEAFIKTFGKPDPNHDWGMNEEIGAIEGLSSIIETRAGSVEVNRNQWTEHNGMTNVVFPTYNNAPNEQVAIPNFRESALGHDIQIPGWPHLNGLYYAANGNVLKGAYKGSQLTDDINIPAGDVTPYEVQYVSWWFRTHKNPVSNVQLHLSDFFIQNVSCDYDQVEYRKTDVTPYNGWPSTGNNGKNISTIEEAQGHKDRNGDAYVDNLSEPISYDLDNLGFKSLDNEWTHVNNFNRGNSNFSPEDSKSNPNREIKFVKSSGTEDFRCHPSWCTDTDWIYSWVLVRLTWVETVKDTNSPYPVGTAIPRDGYYLAFDFHGEKQGQGGKNQVVNQDGYYSNWIVKITPAYFTETGRSRRIFCEDLGGSFDFDFNDAVVDVAFEHKGRDNGKDAYQPIISVQAAGGTMPIYIEKYSTTDEEINKKYELHKMLEADGLTPINVDNSQTHAPAIYRGNTVYASNPGSIKIYVKNTRNNTLYTICGNNPDSEDKERSEYEEGNSTLNGSTLENKTVAPSAFSAFTSVKWTQELKGFHDAYGEFSSWVADKTKNIQWYKTVSKPELIYANAFVEEDGDYHNSTPGYGSDDPISWRDLTPDPTSKTTVAQVKADSWMKINGYTGSDEPIFSNLDNMGDNDRVTIIAILSSTTMYNQHNANGSSADGPKLQAIVVPADINGTSMSYNGVTFKAADLTRFNDATLVDGNHEFGESVYTYSVQFSFTKADILNNTHTTVNPDTRKVDNPYHDYLLFFLKVGNNAAGTGDATGTNNGVTVRHWYVHY